MKLGSSGRPPRPRYVQADERRCTVVYDSRPSNAAQLFITNMVLQVRGVVRVAWEGARLYVYGNRDRMTYSCAARIDDKLRPHLHLVSSVTVRPSMGGWDIEVVLQWGAPQRFAREWRSTFPSILMGARGVRKLTRRYQPEPYDCATADTIMAGIVPMLLTACNMYAPGMEAVASGNFAAAPPRPLPIELAA